MQFLNLTQLHNLNITKNKLKTLPKSLANLKHLNYCFIGHENHFENLPDNKEFKNLLLKTSNQHLLEYCSASKIKAVANSQKRPNVNANNVTEDDDQNKQNLLKCSHLIHFMLANKVQLMSLEEFNATQEKIYSINKKQIINDLSLNSSYCVAGS